MTESDLKKAEVRIPRWMAAILLVACAVFLFHGEWRFALGLVTGGVAGILNYLWLTQAVGAMLATGEGKAPRPILLKMLLRYPLAFAGVYLFYQTGWLPFTGILAGLFVPVGGMLLEGGVQMAIYLTRTPLPKNGASAPVIEGGPRSKDVN